MSHRSRRLARSSSLARRFATHLRSAALLVALASPAGLLAPAAASAAGTYQVYACSNPNGTPAPLDGWKTKNTLAFSGTFNHCPRGGGFGGYMGTEPLAPDHWWTLNQSAEWSVGVQPPLSIQRIDAQRAVSLSTGRMADSGNAHPFYWAQDVASSGLFEDCGTLSGCYGMSATRSYYPGPSKEGLKGGSWTDSGITFVAGCGGTHGMCAPAPVQAMRVLLELSRVTSVLSDPKHPTVAAGIGGTMQHSDVLRGAATVTFQARDEGSGVYQVVTSIGGREIDRYVPDTKSGRCADVAPTNANHFEFHYLVPCSELVDVQHSVDTRRAAEGPQTLEVKLLDAAGNAVPVINRPVTIDNIAPPTMVAPPRIVDEPAGGVRPGDVLKVDDGSWGGPSLKFERRWQHGDGTSWADVAKAEGTSYTVTKNDVGKRLRAVVVARNSEGSLEAGSGATTVVQSGATIVPQTIQPGPGDGSANGVGGDTSSAQMVVDREQRSVEVKYGTKIVVTGRLVDGEGRPIADAEVDVYEQLVTSAAPWTKLATVKTDSQGGYSLRPKTTASRRLRFAYAAQRGAADYRATRDVLVGVSAGMTARATRRVLKPGGVIRLRGRVTLEGLPKTGAWVEVQVLDAGTWRTVGSRRASSRGLWTFKHRLRRSAGVKFQFRALLRTAGDVPSSEAKSPSVKVRVR